MTDSIMRPKLLSIIVTGRNDSHMGNFKYRLTTCISYIASKLKGLGRLDDVEIMITDWNSDVPLSKALVLTPEAAQICRFVYVPPNVARGKLRPDQVFNGACAINVSLRRARGEFSITMPADVIIPNFSLQLLFELLDGKTVLPFKLDSCLFMAGLKNISYDVVDKELDIDEWDRYLLLNSGELTRGQRWPGLGLGALSMMHYSLWHACRGFDEQLCDWGWNEAELTMRISQYHPWIELSSLGIAVFDMDHRGRRGCCELKPRKSNPYIVHSSFAVNDENWGLGGYEPDIQTAENTAKLQKADKHPKEFAPIKIWDKTRGELLAEMTNREAQEHLQSISKKFWWNIDEAEWESLSALAWYSLYRSPRNYLELGIRKEYAAVVVAAASPSVEIYGVDSWQAEDNKPNPSPYSLSKLLYSIGYRGYLRLLTGDPRTAFKRLRDSSIGPLSLDLALVRQDISGTDAIQQLSEIVSCLAPGGMIVFIGASTDNFRHVWGKIQTKFSQFTYLQCKTGKTGLILAVSLSDKDTSASLDIENGLRVDFGNPRGFAGRFHAAYRILWIIKKFPRYTKRIWELFLAENLR